MTSTVRSVALSVCLIVGPLVAPHSASAADQPWVEVKSAHFIVASDGGEETARAIAWQFEQFRTAVLALCPWATPRFRLPVLIVAPSEQAGMKVLAPASWEQPGAAHPTTVSGMYALDRYYLAMQADTLGSNNAAVTPYFTVYQSYAMAVATNLRQQPPMWLLYGLAAVLGNTQVGTTDIDAGRAIPVRLRTLRSGTERLPLKDLLKVDRTSPWAASGTPLNTMYHAEAWAFVHFLTFADKGAHRKQLDRLVALLLDGKTAVAAQEEVFKDVDALQTAFDKYIAQDEFDSAHLKTDSAITRDGFTARTWTSLETRATQALFLTSMNRPVEALALAREVRQLDPQRPEPYEVEGMLADREHKAAETLAGYSKAVELGTTNTYALLRFANILRSSPDVMMGTADPSTLPRAAAAIERAAALNPDQAQYPLQLGEMKVMMNRPFEALGPLRRAIELEPLSSNPHTLVARALWQIGQKQDALAEAREALALARTDIDRNMAQQLIAQYSR